MCLGVWAPGVTDMRPHVAPVYWKLMGHICVSAAYGWRVARGLRSWSL